jgi:hypothetical protein
MARMAVFNRNQISPLRVPGIALMALLLLGFGLTSISRADSLDPSSGFDRLSGIRVMEREPPSVTDFHSPRKVRTGRPVRISLKVSDPSLPLNVRAVLKARGRAVSLSKSLPESGTARLAIPTWWIRPPRRLPPGWYRLRVVVRDGRGNPTRLVRPVKLLCNPGVRSEST